MICVCCTGHSTVQGVLRRVILANVCMRSSSRYDRFVFIHFYRFTLLLRTVFVLFLRSTIAQDPCMCIFLLFRIKVMQTTVEHIDSVLLISKKKEKGKCDKFIRFVVVDIVAVGTLINRQETVFFAHLHNDCDAYTRVQF